MSISIIVPIYNNEKYLEKCLTSIKNQTFKDFEVVMVDDGSTDNSAEICKRVSEEDGRFKYFYKENGGSSSARNLGLKNAKGDYIAFIDSDDYVDNDYLECLVAGLGNENYDIVQCGMRLIKNGKTTELVPSDADYKELQFIETVLKRDFQIFLFQTTVTKLYRREFIVKSKIVFDEEAIRSEDCLFNTELLPYIRSVKTLSEAKYNYIQDNSFLSKLKPSFDKIFQGIRVGNITSGIRFSTIKQYKLDDNVEIKKGFQTAICIIYISNAHEIETAGFSKKDKEKLYDSYFSVMNYPIDLAVNGFQGTDKQIALASAKKDRKAIERIYKLRNAKQEVLRIIKR